MTPEEVQRRLETVMMLNETVRQLRAAAEEAYQRGEIPWRPKPDIRTDLAYWRRLAEEKARRSPQE
jgi:hypothetical protein